MTCTAEKIGMAASVYGPGADTEPETQDYFREWLGRLSLANRGVEARGY